VEDGVAALKELARPRIAHVHVDEVGARGGCAFGAARACNAHELVTSLLQEIRRSRAEKARGPGDEKLHRARYSASSWR
jgi:hypothetical protein